MEGKLEETKSLLLGYLSQFNHNDVINIKWLLRIVEVNLNTSLSESVLTGYLKEQGFTHIINTSDLEKKNKHLDEKETKGVFPVGKEQKATIEELDESEEDFDPNLFLKENKDKIMATVIDEQSYKNNTWLIETYKNNRDKNAFFKIVAMNQGLVEKVAAHYANNFNHKLQFEDLVSVGKFGLLKAIEKFKPDLGYQFSTYAFFWIKQTISRAVMDEGTTIRIPVHIYEQLSKLTKKESECLKNGNYLDINWICNELEISLEKYYQLKRIDYSFLQLTSLNTDISNDEEDNQLINFIEYSPEHVLGAEILDFISPLDQIIIKNRNERIETVLSTLSEKESSILKHRFGFYDGESKTLQEIGDLYGLTRERIRQIEKKSIRKLRARFSRKKMNYLDLIP